MGIWRTKRWHTSYSIIQRRIELGTGSLHLELCSCGLYMGCSGITGPVPLVCFLQVKSVVAALMGEEGGAGGWRGEKTTGLAYRQGSRLERGEKTMCTFFFFANLAYVQHKEFALLSDFRFMRSHIFSISVVLPDSEEPLWMQLLVTKGKTLETNMWGEKKIKNREAVQVLGQIISMEQNREVM